MFWDLDDILAEQTKVLCKFNQPVRGYGFLDGSGGTLQKDVWVELPFWAAYPMAIEWLDMETPECFKDNVRQDLMASATSVNLAKICPYFYCFAYKMGQVMQLDKNLIDLLFTSFKQRMSQVCDYSVTGHYDPTSPFIISLDAIEKKLYRIGCLGTNQMKQWNSGKHLQLKDKKRKSEISY